MLWDIALFVLGIAVLVGGAEVLVRGGSSLAKRLGMSPLMIGLTIVALGTSAPELVVSANAAATGHGDVALGNVVGSNILNTFIVLGITAALYPVLVQRRTVREDLPLVAAISLLAWAMMWDGRVSRMDGALLFLIVVPYLRHLYQRERGLDYQEAAAVVESRHPALAALAVAGGIGLLVWGGDLVVGSGTSLARSFGVPERVIALTLVAFGTSAPELATSIVAAMRRRVDLAVGNVVGSNLLNILVVLGGASLIAPIPVPDAVQFFDAPVMIGGALVLIQFASTRFRITRPEGLALVGLYGLYLGIVIGHGL